MRARKLILTILIVNTVCSVAAGLVRHGELANMPGHSPAPVDMRRQRNELRQLIEQHGLPFVQLNEGALLS